MDNKPTDDEERPAGESEWDTPRWRSPDDEVQGDVEHDHRLRDDDAPGQPGAIDEDDSVGSS